MTRSERLRLWFRVYVEMWDACDGNPAKVAQEFEALAEYARSKIPRKPKSRHNPEFTMALLAAYDSAPKGQITKRIAEVAEAYGRDATATMRNLRRLLAERKRRDNERETHHARMNEAIRIGDMEAARNLHIDRLERLVGYPLPARFREERDPDR